MKMLRTLHIFLYVRIYVHENVTYFVHVYVLYVHVDVHENVTYHTVYMFIFIFMFMFMFMYVPVPDHVHVHVYVYTGWGAQSWTVFCGPAAVAIGGCERKD
jgi:hypothetical protein